MPTAAEERGRAAAESEAAAVGRAYFAAVAARDPAAMGACWVLGGLDVLHGVASLQAPEGVEEWFANTFRAIPDFEMEVVDLLAAGEKVAIRWHMTGTFSGDARFEGAIATGARVDITGCDVLTVRDGKIVHNDAYLNGMELARQLGLLPPQGSGQERAMVGATNLKTRVAGLLRGERKG
jgi:predicted ester cyclase